VEGTNFLLGDFLRGEFFMGRKIQGIFQEVNLSGELLHLGSLPEIPSRIDMLRIIVQGKFSSGSSYLKGITMGEEGFFRRDGTRFPDFI